MRSLLRAVASTAAVVSALFAVEAEAASRLELVDVRTQASARPNEWIRVTWSTRSSLKVTDTDVSWGTAPGKLDGIGEGAHTGPAGSRAFYGRIRVPDHPCTLYYVVHAKDAAGHRVESREDKVRIEFPPLSPDAIAFTRRPHAAIPDDDPRGITEEIDIAQTGVLNRVEVRIDIEHPRRGDLSVVLVSPRGTRVVLHEHGTDTRKNIRGCWGDGVPGDLASAESLAILQGEHTQGKWKLLVADEKTGEKGELSMWELIVYKHEVSGPRSPDECLPQLVMLPPDEVDITYLGKTKIVEFSTTVENLGKGPLMMRGQWNPQTNAQDAYQEIYKKKYDAQGKFEKFEFVREEKIGEFIFDSDEGHQHFHFENWASYLLLDEHFRPAKGAKDQIKVSFAIEDVEEVDPKLEGASLGGMFGSGSSQLQGISVGWADTYGAGLEGQSVDITHTPDGIYYLVLQGSKLVDEEDSSGKNWDNDAADRIEIRGDNVTILEKLTGRQFHERRTGIAPSGAPVVPPARSGPVSFAHEIQPIFDAHCTRCHRAHAALAPFSLEARDSYRSIVNVPALEVSALDRVQPDSPQSSYLWHKVEGTQHQVGGSGDTMPVGGHLDAAEFAKIRRWIVEGAPDN